MGAEVRPREQLLGIVTEGDLLRRVETGTERQHSRISSARCRSNLPWKVTMPAGRLSLMRRQAEQRASETLSGRGAHCVTEGSDDHRSDASPDRAGTLVASCINRRT